MLSRQLQERSQMKEIDLLSQQLVSAKPDVAILHVGEREAEV